MKKLSFLLLPLIGIAALYSFRTEKTVLLRLNLKKGQAYLYKTNLVQNITTQISGQTLNVKMNIDMAMNVNVAHKYNADSTLLQARYQYLSIHIAAMGNEVSLDSRDTTDSRNKQLNQIISATQDNPIIIKTNALGKILDIRGLEKLRKAVGSSQSPSVQKAVKQILDENTFKQSFTNLGIFPEQAIAEGDRWEKTITVKQMASMNITTTYTVKDIQPKNVVLHFTSDVSSLQDSITLRGMTLPAHVTGTQSGTYTINRSTGLIPKGVLNQKMNIKMSMMGKDMIIDIDGKIDITERPSQ